MNNYNEFIGTFIKYLKTKNNLTSEKFITLLNLNLTPYELHSVEKGMLDLSISDFSKIIYYFNLDIDKIYYLCQECTNNVDNNIVQIFNQLFNNQD
ncbi:hypothetical protein ACFX5K_03485 [Rickettsiales bacterium LUAb2]